MSKTKPTGVVSYPTLVLVLGIICLLYVGKQRIPWICLGLIWNEKRCNMSRCLQLSLGDIILYCSLVDYSKVSFGEKDTFKWNHAYEECLFV